MAPVRGTQSLGNFGLLWCRAATSKRRQGRADAGSSALNRPRKPGLVHPFFQRLRGLDEWNHGDT